MFHSTFKLFISILVIFIISFSYASSPTTMYISHITQGYGKDINEAVENAILNGMREVNGIYIDNIKVIVDSRTHRDGYSIFNDYQYKTINSNILSKESILAVKEATKGFIKKYKLISQRKTIDGWNVTIKLNIAKYKTIKESSKYSIAVLPFKVLKSNQKDYEISKILNQLLKDRIVKSKTLQLVARDKNSLSGYLKEVRLLNSKNINPIERNKLNQLVGIDYLLIGSVDEFMIREYAKNFYGTKFNGYQVKARVNYRLIEMATMKIYYSDTFEYTLPDPSISKLLASSNENSVMPLRNFLLEKVANRISLNIRNIIKK